MSKSRWVALFAFVFWVLSCSSSITPAMAQSISSSTSSSIVAMSSAKKPLFSFSGKRPTNLGIKDGKLAPCPSSPNCVSSQSPDTDAEHHISPLTYQSDAITALAHLKAAIATIERSKIITETENYLYSEFISALMGFVDDVEFYLDPTAKVIHVRSASRLGQSDLGVNRNRIETIRAKFREIDQG